MRKLTTIAIPLGAALLAALSAAGAGSAARGGVRLVQVGRFDQPVYVTAPPGDPGRVLVVEKGGAIRVIRGGRTLSKPFLDLHGRVSTDTEQGLLSMAFAPSYRTTHRLYVYFTDRRGDIHIREYRAASADRANARTGRNVLTVGHSRFTNHNGGQLQFGPDRLLYAGIGDGGSEGDPFNRGQNLHTLLAKLIRIDPHRHGRRGYRIPRGNPFGRGTRREIYSYGLRNPYRFSFDRATGAIAIADVGQDLFEEVDYARRGGARGRNYGWSVWEADHRYKRGRAAHAVFPVIVETHGAGWCAIIGGYVVRDRSLPSLYGRYVFGDNCKAQIHSAVLARGRAHGERGEPISVPRLSSFGEDALGRVYATSLRGPVYRLAAG